MIVTLIWILLSFIAAAIALWLIRLGLTAMGVSVPQPIWVLVCVVVALFVLLFALRQIGISDSVPGCGPPAAHHR